MLPTRRWLKGKRTKRPLRADNRHGSNAPEAVIAATAKLHILRFHKNQEAKCCSNRSFAAVYLECFEAARCLRANGLGEVMTKLFEGEVEVHYGQVYIELDGSFDGAMENCFHGQKNGLCGAQAPAILFLMTGLHTGIVGISIHLLDAEPDIDESWEEIVKVSFQASEGKITLMEWAADQGVDMAVPAGSYRTRYHGRAMQAANELDANLSDTPVDSYRLDLWTGLHAPDRVVKQTSTVAAYWHDWSSKLAADG